MISLYPLKQRGHIISLKHTENPFEKVLKKLPIPKLTASVYLYRKRVFSESKMFCEDIVASSDNPRRMLTALANLKDAHVTLEECCTVLQYFAKEINFGNNESLIRGLKQLPFYPALSGQCVTLLKWNKVCVVTDWYPNIPTDGLRDLFASLGQMYIKYDPYYEGLLQHLRLEKWSKERLYAEVIVPNMMQLTADARMQHLLHIRDHICAHNMHFNDERTNVLQRLKHIPFITTRDGQQHYVSDFYSSRKPELKLMCPPSAFLPSPYDEDEWQSLLTQLDLKCHLSVEDFVHFAKDLEEKSKHGITREVEKISNLFTDILRKRVDIVEDDIWFRIRDIRFVLPFNIKAERSHGLELHDIHPQFENAERLVAYADCCNPIHCDTVWTSCSMWTSDADPTKFMSRQKSVEVLNQLGVAQEPSLEHCIVHLQSISKALRQKGVVFRKQQQTLLKQIFTDMYHYLQKHMANAVIKNMLFAFPVVFIVETCELVPAVEVVIDLGKSEKIPGYIFKAPPFFGRFFDLFEILGAQKTVSPKTYAMVLHRLYRKTQGTKLNVNELKIVEKVVMNLVECLSKETEAIVEIGKLYLPNEDCMLVNSTSLVLRDRDDLAIRMESQHLNFFLGYEKVEIPLAKLAAEHRLVPLSSLVTETLSSKCSEHVSTCGKARVYEQRIKSSDFINGISRLCNDHSQELSTQECLEIQGRISQVCINQVEDLETVLIFKGNEIEGSGKNKSCFISMNNEHETENSSGICRIYISSVHSQEDTITQIAFAIDSLANDHLGRYTSLVEKMLLIEPGRIQSYLNDHGIKKNTTTNKKSSVVYPKVGTLIPEEFHDKLFNTFFTFSVGEYVGLCVYDPTEDEAHDATKGSLPVYVYAIVDEVENDSSPITARYRLEVEEDVTESMSATMMYKLYREDTDTNNELMVAYDNVNLNSSNMQSILTDIRCQLQGAWNCLTTKERNRVRIRLLTLWHPDRNPENVQICTTVCQHISLYVQHLDRGESLSHLKFNTETTDMSVFNEVSRRIRVQRQTVSKRESSSHGWCHQGSKQKAFPHFGEALRWLKQSVKDLEAAAKSIKSRSPFNWSCYQSHQAAEKALKAVLYTIDSQRADELKNHNITTIASGLGMELESLASKLNGGVGNYNALRYPDRSGYPKIPSEKFSSSDAILCFKLAKEIVDLADQRVQRS